MKTVRKSWLNENIGAIIAIGFMLFAFYIFRMILLKETTASDAVQVSIVECMKGAIFIIVGYFFGSSIGSKLKQEAMEKAASSIMDPQPPEPIQPEPKVNEQV